MTRKLQLILKSALLVMIVVSCQSEHSLDRESPASARGALDAGSVGDTTYRDTLMLVAIGGEPVLSRDESSRQCDQRPFWSQMLVGDGVWSIRDSLFIDCPTPREGGRLFSRLTSGTFEVRGDTLVFLSGNPEEGEEGVIFLSVKDENSIQVLGADEEGRDFVYRRIRSR